MSAGKSACNHLPLEEWKEKLEQIHVEFNNELAFWSIHKRFPKNGSLQQFGPATNQQHLYYRWCDNALL